MKNIRFLDHVLPHIIAIAVFLLVTLIFFRPAFFDNKALQQHDIQEWEGSSKELRDFRKETGEEGLWANSMFSGMPAYLINVEWGNKSIGYLKKIMGFSLPHPFSNIYLAFVCYYILLLSFRIRPYLAIGGALAFGLSSFMLIGLLAGHNARIGAIAFMPLVVAGVHLVFSERKILGFGVAATGFALHLRENHLQITYYLAIIIVAYGIVQLVWYYKEGRISDWLKNVGLLIPAILIAIGSFLGPLWGISEYTGYSIRGKSELVPVGSSPEKVESGQGKEWAFEFSNAILEPMTLLIPNFYGGATSNFLVLDEESETRKALMNAADQETINQLANYTSAYWGPQRLAAPYYAGAIIVFLFAIGIAFADRRAVWWLVPVAILGVVLSWGKNFEAFNYFLFDYLPGYNKFRSVTFTLVLILFAMPLLGMIGLETFLQEENAKEAKKKLLKAFIAVGGLCLVVLLLSGALAYVRDAERQLPSWFTNALADDRKSLLMGDIFRSLGFIVVTFALLYFGIYKKSFFGFAAILTFLITVDLASVDKRYMTEENFKRKREATPLTMNQADELILKDKSYFRVFNLQNPWNEARTSYYHHSLGGYHGAKLKRYQDLLDSCLYTESNELIQDAQAGQIRFDNYGVFNMLNAKYFVYGEQKEAVIRNPAANGNAWFVDNVKLVNSPTEELTTLCSIDTKTTAVVDDSKFDVAIKTPTDSSGSVTLLEYKPNYLKYESNSTTGGLVVFSEIYYEKGWTAKIDNQETKILRANYVLRALPVTAGKHTIEFRFAPTAYTTGNAITTASSWLVILVLFGSIGYSLKRSNEG